MVSLDFKNADVKSGKPGKRETSDSAFLGKIIAKKFCGFMKISYLCTVDVRPVKHLRFAA